MSNAFREAVERRDVDAMAAGLHPGVVFRSPAGFQPYQGRDYLKYDGDGLITELTVMIRPLSGLIALAPAVGERLAAEAPA